MRTIALLTSTLAALGAASCGEPPAPCPEGVGTDGVSQPDSFRRVTVRGHDAHRQLIQRLEARAAGQAFAPATARNNQCLDVADNNLANGGRLQLWQCSGGDNQKWRLEGPLLQTSRDLCVDVPGGNAYNGAPLQVWKCDGQNRNQAWTQTGSGQLQWAGSNFCLDVTGGAFSSGTRLQLWQCFDGSANQQWRFGSSPAPAPAAPAVQQPQQVSSGATMWQGHYAIGIDDFCNRHPECAPYKSAFVDAARDQGLNPTFLASIAMIESGCSPYPAGPNGRFGAYQFMDDNAWRVYGLNRDRTNFWDAAYGAARYFRALLDGNGWNLDNAIRNYNGPIASGGEPRYQDWCYTWMSGGNPH